MSSSVAISSYLIIPPLNYSTLQIQLVCASDDPNNLAIVCELCENKSLYHVLHDPEIRLSKKQKIKIALDVANGMSYLHSRGIVHRDLKTLNLLVKKDLATKVIQTVTHEFVLHINLYDCVYICMFCQSIFISLYLHLFLCTFLNISYRKPSLVQEKWKE